ncbi:MAG TPA: 2-dehydro-3-deoxy-D-gluconate 5-dehydrogenase KduD [Pyrinomonadaceae bacterium]|nr:2-dehydro-3-deoxy-D-gluconate 5-dehydrogenase KduD [Pyrinomonadaceae bacterium]
MSPFSLEGKVALVTGSAKGIGRAIAVGMAAAGADVVCHCRKAGDAAETIAEIEAIGRRAVEVTGDMSNAETPAAVVADAAAAFGKLDILINNAGTIRRAPAAEFSAQDWQDVIDINLTSVFRLAQEAGKLMLAQGSGKIVNIASLLSFQGGITVPAYTAAKSAVAGLTKALANEWASKGVNVNAIAPGYIATDNTTALRADETRNRQILERIPAGRWGEASDIAGAAVFLSSDASNYIHGHIMVVDGGWMGR